MLTPFMLCHRDITSNDVHVLKLPALPALGLRYLEDGEKDFVGSEGALLLLHYWSVSSSITP